MKKFFIETFKGISGDASAKRATAFYFTVVLVSSLHIAYIVYMFKNKTLEYFPYVYCGYLIFIALLLGLATIENITGLINTIKGYAKTNNINSGAPSSTSNISNSSGSEELQNEKTPE